MNKLIPLMALALLSSLDVPRKKRVQRWLTISKLEKSSIWVLNTTVKSQFGKLLRWTSSHPTLPALQAGLIVLMPMAIIRALEEELPLASQVQKIMVELMEMLKYIKYQGLLKLIIY